MLVRSGFARPQFIDMTTFEFDKIPRAPSSPLSSLVRLRPSTPFSSFLVVGFEIFLPTIGRQKSGIFFSALKMFQTQKKRSNACLDRLHMHWQEEERKCRCVNSLGLALCCCDYFLVCICGPNSEHWTKAFCSIEAHFAKRFNKIRPLVAENGVEPFDIDERSLRRPEACKASLQADSE